MSGSIQFHKTGHRYYVAWYHEKKVHKIYRYQGKHMFRAFDDKGRDLGLMTAQKLLAAMQSDVENGCFRLEKYTRQETDVVPYLLEWLKAIKTTIAPSTYKDYEASIRLHLKPFFSIRAVMLHEIQYDTLMELLGNINREGKGRLNVIMCLHACLEYAWRSNRIPVMPAFPKKKDYNIVVPTIKWLPEERQHAIIKAIPLDDQPIFWWLAFHLRRPGEAMALRKEDYQDGLFTVRRGVSNYQEIDRPKDRQQHLVPMVSDFAPYLAVEQEKQRRAGIVSPYFFVSLRGRRAGKRYTSRTMMRIWAMACKETGEEISLYPGTKHSRACQLLNDYGLSKSDLKEAGDWARMESVDKYAKVEVATRKNLLEGKVKKFERKEKKREEK